MEALIYSGVAIIGSVALFVLYYLIITNKKQEKEVRINMEIVKVKGKSFCAICGKEQTEVEYVVGQCNECDPFEEEHMLEEMFGQPQYIDPDQHK